MTLLIGFLGTASGARAAETHSGTATVSGGGVVVVFGQEGAQRQVVVTGGGVVTATGLKSTVGTVATLGGGVLSATGQKSAQLAVSVNGGGVLTATGSAAVGGDRSGTVSVSGGGSLTVTGTRFDPSIQTTVVGRYVPRQFQRQLEHKTGRVSVRGGGRAHVDGEKHTTGTAFVAGGGSVDATGQKSARVVLTPQMFEGQTAALGSKHIADRVQVTGAGDVTVGGQKRAVGLVLLPVDGTTTARGQKRYPHRIAHLIALAA